MSYCVLVKQEKRCQKNLKRSNPAKLKIQKQKTLYKEQISFFKDYAEKSPKEDLLCLFDKWSEINNIYGVEKQEIWRIARRPRKRKTFIIKEGSEECIRLQAVLDIVLEIDLTNLSKLLEERKNKEK